jgi:lysophospholipase L1-like esterase
VKRFNFRGIWRKRILCFGCKIIILTLLQISLSGIAQEIESGNWKTAFVKRGFVGAFKDEQLGCGYGTILRTRTPIPFGGTAVRVKVSGNYNTATEMESMALVKGADDYGTVAGPRYPIHFKGKPSVTLKGITSIWSDIMQIPVESGTWYVEDTYPGSEVPYAYDVDTATCGAKGTDELERFKRKLSARVGTLVRIDVLTTEPASVIVCYGDSITHGFGSTPNSGKRYPDQLSQILDRPVLNLGVNGDRINSAGGAPGEIRFLKGVDTVVFMMGINDILAGSVKNVSDFSQKIRPMIAALQQQELKVFLGTIPPAGGFEQYDRKPEYDVLRNSINDWIRLKSRADGVVDFDLALRDPNALSRMMSDYQMDWVHPNDLGYRKMAEAAANAILAENELKKPGNKEQK